ncbi:MAG: hypothetical protein HQL53_10265, partial [Magnetococcales bacterium]|nr:hypothetical protein [Magnetococcales bacterium]
MTQPTLPILLAAIFIALSPWQAQSAHSAKSRDWTLTSSRDNQLIPNMRKALANKGHPPSMLRDRIHMALRFHHALHWSLKSHLKIPDSEASQRVARLRMLHHQCRYTQACAVDEIATLLQQVKQRLIAISESFPSGGTQSAQAANLALAARVATLEAKLKRPFAKSSQPERSAHAEAAALYTRAAKTLARKSQRSETEHQSVAGYLRQAAGSWRAARQPKKARPLTRRAHAIHRALEDAKLARERNKTLGLEKMRQEAERSRALGEPQGKQTAQLYKDWLMALQGHYGPNHIKLADG